MRTENAAPACGPNGPGAPRDQRLESLQRELDELCRRQEELWRSQEELRAELRAGMSALRASLDARIEPLWSWLMRFLPVAVLALLAKLLVPGA